MKILIKNMVTIRCKMAVKSVLESLGLPYYAIDLGEVQLKEDLTVEERGKLRTALLHYGLELLDNKRTALIEKIKAVVVEMVHYDDELPAFKNSLYISGKLGYDYTYLSNVFSQVTCTTIEHYIIAHKIERAKELLVYDELSLKEISYKLRYSSVAHLSAQFKKLTGLTPTHFKQLKRKGLKSLNDVTGLIVPMDVKELKLEGFMAAKKVG